MKRKQTYYDVDWFESAIQGQLVIKEVYAFKTKEEVKLAYKYVKDELLKIIQEESLKLEEKYGDPMDIQWDDIFDDVDESMDVSVELAFNCMNRIIDIAHIVR